MGKQGDWSTTGFCGWLKLFRQPGLNSDRSISCRDGLVACGGYIRQKRTRVTLTIFALSRYRGITTVHSFHRSPVAHHDVHVFDCVCPCWAHTGRLDYSASFYKHSSEMQHGLYFQKRCSADPDFHFNQNDNLSTMYCYLRGDTHLHGDTTAHNDDKHICSDGV